MTHSPLPNIYTRSIKNVFRRAPVRVGIVVGGAILPYAHATAVARLRAYDVIEMFAADPHTLVELYLPWRRYDIVLFEKTFTVPAVGLAKKLKRRGVKILLDVNVDYFTTATPRVTPATKKLADEFAQLADAIMAPSESLIEELRRRHIHDHIAYIPEPIPERYFNHRKRTFTAVPRLVWSGYVTKARELLAIQEQIHMAQKTYGATLTIISNHDPQLTLQPYSFVRYRERNIADQLAIHDVFIAPRQFNQPYKYYHTFTKIGSPMAIGLPVIASPVPSYAASPALFCHSSAEWHAVFQAVYEGKIDLNELSKRGRMYCQHAFSWARVRAYYATLFHEIKPAS